MAVYDSTEKRYGVQMNTIYCIVESVSVEGETEGTERNKVVGSIN